MDDEINSVTNCLRNTFLNKIPSKEEILKTCDTLAEKLGADTAARNDVRLGLMDVIDEALQGGWHIFMKGYSSVFVLELSCTEGKYRPEVGAKSC